jgi:hypothetical protein
MSARQSLASLAELARAFGLLAGSADESACDADARGQTIDVTSGEFLIRRITTADGRTSFQACWRDQGGLRVAEFRTRDAALDAHIAAGRDNHGATASCIQILDVTVDRLSEEDASTAAGLLGALIDFPRLSRAPAQTSQRPEKSDGEGIETAA